MWMDHTTVQYEKQWQEQLTLLPATSSILKCDNYFLYLEIKSLVFSVADKYR